jgi:hypothetical protein
MTTKTLDDITRRILNDPDIFSPPYDRNTRSAIPLLFEAEVWEQLKEAFEERDKNSFNSIVDAQCQNLQQKEQNANQWRRNKIGDTIEIGKALKNAYDQKPYILGQMFDKLDSFGIIECKLPNMEDYGKVIENHNHSTVEQYFLSKIDRASGYQKRALRKTLEYVKELYAMNLDILEIAFFIRKLNSLTQFTEVIKDE